jgi:hypothetical protein
MHAFNWFRKPAAAPIGSGVPGYSRSKPPSQIPIVREIVWASGGLPA